jgi:hypothetical protein
MNVGASLVANQEATEAVQPCEGPFNDPSRDAEAAAVRRAASGEDGDDAFHAEPITMALRMVAAIALQDVGPPAGPAASTSDLGHGADQWVELRNVIDVRGGHLGDERNAAGLDNDVVFRALLTAIGWVRSSFFPRATRGPTRYRRRPSANRAGRAGEVLRATRPAARPPRVATAPIGASNCCPTHSPFLSAASATECRSAGRRRYRSTPPDSQLAAGPSFPGAAGAARVRSVPTTHHQRTDWICAWPTEPSGRIQYKGSVRLLKRTLTDASIGKGR